MSTLQILNEETSDGVVYFELNGALDIQSFERVEELFSKHMDAGIVRFIVNLSQVSTISSSGAGVLISTAGTCQEDGGDVVILEPSHEVYEIFEVLGVFQLFPIAYTREEAFEVFGKKTI